MRPDIAPIGAQVSARTVPRRVPFQGVDGFVVEAVEVVVVEAVVLVVEAVDFSLVEAADVLGRGRRNRSGRGVDVLEAEQDRRRSDRRARQCAHLLGECYFKSNGSMVIEARSRRVHDRVGAYVVVVEAVRLAVGGGRAL